MKVVGLRDLADFIFLLLNKFSFRFLSTSQEEILARFIGDIAYIVVRGRRRITASRLSAVLGDELTPHQIGRLTKETFRQKLVEQFSFSAVNRKIVCQRVITEGLEQLHEALGRRRGVILWESPLGKRFLAKALLAEKGFPICQVHEQRHGGSPTWLGQRVIRRIYRKAEAKLFPEIIDIQNDSFAYLRPLINRLKQNGIVCIVGFGQSGHKFIPVKFLGARQDFPTGAVSLARMTGASIIPIFCLRENGIDHLVIEKPINLDGSGDWDIVLTRAITKYARLLESYILKHPDQWYLWHELREIA